MINYRPTLEGFNEACHVCFVKVLKISAFIDACKCEQCLVPWAVTSWRKRFALYLAMPLSQML